MVFALLCWVSALLIPRTGEAAPNLIINKNIATSTWTLISAICAATSGCGGAALVTSWFWLAGVVVLSLLPPAVKNIIGGDEYAVTAYLAVFSIAVAVGSGLAAFLAQRTHHPSADAARRSAAGGLSRSFLGWSLWRAAAGQRWRRPRSSAPRGINVAIALAGLAIGGGLFIVPAFAAVQAWAGADRRARVVAAVNILNALFMTAATLVVAMLQAWGVTTPTLFIGLGVANLDRRSADRLHHADAAVRRRAVHHLPRLLSCRSAWSRKLQKVNQPNVILALNHVSFLDAGIALSLLGRDPLFAIDTTMAQKWWVKPFTRMTRSLPIDPLKPMATRTLIHAVAGRRTLIIFPEGRLTMTGSLMKVYDGAGLIADKSDAVIVPIRIEGLERSPSDAATTARSARSCSPRCASPCSSRPSSIWIRPARQGTTARGGCRALRHHVGHDLRDHADRPHHRRGADRGGARARHETRGDRGPRSPARSPTSGCCSAPASSARS